MQDLQPFFVRDVRNKSDMGHSRIVDKHVNMAIGLHSCLNDFGGCPAFSDISQDRLASRVGEALFFDLV